MTEHANADYVGLPALGWTTFFAQESDQDLEFDEGLEEDDLNQHKPPTRRPLLWILLLLIVVGVVYWTMKPDLAKLPELSSPMATIDDIMPSSDESQVASQTPSHTSAPVPQFGEGDAVMLSQHESKTHPLMTLTHDPAGSKPGPKVKAGERLTILDGEAIDKHWVYQVNTSNGKKGWILGKLLEKKH
ncbi:MAG: hypothetical protein ACPGYT_02430 [Nitrospirales bacterium]